MEEVMTLFHATTTAKATTVIEQGFRSDSVVWDHAGVVFFSDRPLCNFGDLSGSSWIVVEATPELLATDEYEASEREWDEEQYACRCFCLPVGQINPLPMREEQGLC
jgi:hypothetical protein